MDFDREYSMFEAIFSRITDKITSIIDTEENDELDLMLKNFQLRQVHISLRKNFYLKNSDFFL